MTFLPLQMHHSMDQLDMLDPTGSMTTLAPISESPLTPTHQHLHGSYHSMNHMMSHHHPGTLSGHTGVSDPISYSFYSSASFWSSYSYFSALQVTMDTQRYIILSSRRRWLPPACIPTPTPIPESWRRLRSVSSSGASSWVS